MKRVPVRDLLDQELFILIGEEAAEICQAAAKIQRFGLGNHHPDRPGVTNFIELVGEFDDLGELILELIDRVGGRPNKQQKERLVVR